MPGVKMNDYAEVTYQSADGLTLYARDYGAPAAVAQAPTLLCMHGLTRNSRDFEPLAALLCDRVRLVSMDQRGRGRSDYDSNTANYQPITYVGDMFALITALKLENIVLVGTSMGGLMAMMMVAMQPTLFHGLIINDIAPEIDPVGLDRIKGYVGQQTGSFADWPAALAAVKKANGSAFPNYSDSDWLAFTRRLCDQRSDGSVVFSYDAGIAAPLTDNPDAAVPPDLWPLFRATQSLPTLVIHGALSDILSDSIVARMRTENPMMNYARVEAVGHAPILDEPEALAAIEDLLRSI